MSSIYRNALLTIAAKQSASDSGCFITRNGLRNRICDIGLAPVTAGLEDERKASLNEGIRHDRNHEWLWAFSEKGSHHFSNDKSKPVDSHGWILPGSAFEHLHPQLRQPTLMEVRLVDYIRKRSSSQRTKDRKRMECHLRAFKNHFTGSRYLDNLTSMSNDYLLGRAEEELRYIIREFCSRQLTKPSGRHAAISGILQAWGDAFKREYVVGIWTDEEN